MLQEHSNKYIKSYNKQNILGTKNNGNLVTYGNLEKKL